MMETNWLRSYHLIITEGEKKIPLPNVAKSILQKVITYCEYHANSKDKDGNDKSEDD